jgi:hypothetical protein
MLAVLLLMLAVAVSMPMMQNRPTLAVAVINVGVNAAHSFFCGTLLRESESTCARS